MIEELLDTLASAIANSDKVRNYCLAKFDKNLTVMVGLEPEDEPETTQYPLAALSNVAGSERGDGFAQEQLQVVLCTTIESTATNTNVVSGSVIKKWFGFVYVEELRRLIENAILNINGLGWKLSVSGETVLTTFYPQFAAISIVTLSRPKSKSSGRGFSQEQ